MDVSKGRFVVELLQGETVARFEAITKAPDRDDEKSRKEHATYYLVQQWSPKFDFVNELNDFSAAFNAADFTAASAVSSMGVATGALSGPRF